MFHMNQRTALHSALFAPPLMDALEQRQMLAIHPAMWVIRGSSHDDSIVIQVNPNNANQLQAVLNNHIVSVRNPLAVSGIKITGAGGDDDISVDLGQAFSNIRTTLNGGGGDDSLDGGAGRDKLVGGPGGDSLNGGLGNDSEFGDDGNDLLAGDEGDDDLTGDAGNDTVAGGLGDDDIDGGTGGDKISGGYGDDDEEGGIGIDTLAGGDGVDSLDGGSGKDIIFREKQDYWKYNRLDVTRPDVRSNPLKQVQDADTLKQMLINAALKDHQGQYGQPYYPYYSWYERGIYAPGGLSYDVAGSAASAGTPAPQTAPTHSGTNNQVGGVDEQDIVKNDGNFIYVLQDNNLVILNAWPADQTHIVSTTPIDGWSSGLYLDGDRVTVISDTWVNNQIDPLPASEGSASPIALLPVYWGGKSQTAITVYNVADRANPTVVSKTTLDGWSSDSRDIDGKIYLVLNNSISLPQPIPIPNPDPDPDPTTGDAGGTGDGTGAVSGTTKLMPDPNVFYLRPFQGHADYVYESGEDYRASLEAMDLTQLLPGWTSVANGVTTTGGLADPTQIYLPATDRDLSSMFSVVTFNATDDTPQPLSSTSVVGLSGDVYVSATSLYVTSQTWDSPMGNWEGDYRTDIYEFALNPDSVTFEGTGQVPGWAINSYAMDEQGDTFRIATTTEENGESNNLFVLKDTGDTLDPIGGITGLAFDESIEAARFVGDRAYLVTFHQTDPLFSIDLSDPTNPTLAGVLEMPGYSSYLYPIDADHLIGLGRDADAQGNIDGLKVSLFDVSDINNPKLVDTFKFDTTSPMDKGKKGWWSDWNSSPAEWDPHAFSYFPDQHVLAVPVLDWGWWHDNARLEVLQVDEKTGFTEIGQVEHGDEVLRSLQIGDYLYSLSSSDLKVVSINDPADEVADVVLSQAQQDNVAGLFQTGEPIA
jgi:uncharacterized secreted protein with C-terminal beta-propeller domain